jgi:hypothetical protein
MNRRLRAAWFGIPLVTALGSISLASAHGPGHGNAGTITRVSGTSVTLQLKNGSSVTDALTSSTRVTKTAAASASDLIAGTVVNLTLAAAGSTSVTAVHLESAHPKATTTIGAHKVTGAATHVPKVRTRATPTAKTGTEAHVNLQAGGTIVSANASGLTLKNRAGQDVIYTLANGAKISKTVAGSLSDLKVGQTVSIGTSHGSTTAASVIIIKG